MNYKIEQMCKLVLISMFCSFEFYLMNQNNLTLSFFFISECNK